MQNRPNSIPARLIFLSFLATPGLAGATQLQQEDVLVTASRVPENALHLPLSWSVVDDRELELVEAVHINEIMQRVPGAWISRGNGQESLIALRSPVFTGPGSCGAFYTAADGISLRAPGFCNVNQLFDANFEQSDRIEVIRGPATALYGSNAMHGVINILSAAPTEHLDHSLALEAGPDDYYRAKYRYSDTVGRHGFNISVNGTTDGGYKDDSGYDQQKATLRHDYSGQVWQLRTVLDAANLNQETAGFIKGYKAYEKSDLKKSNPNPEAYRDAWSLRLYSSASRSLDDASTLTITPYVRDNDMEFLQHFLPWQPVEENDHSSLGLRSTIHTDLDSLRWVNGIDMEYTDATLKETQEDAFDENRPQGVHYDYQVDATTAAAYSQLRSLGNWPWEFTAGARLEYSRYDYNNRTGDGDACGPAADDCRFYRPADRDDDFTNWSLNGGVSYSFSNNHVGFARLARGFRAPQATELYRLQSGQQTADLDSEEINNLEVGLRGAPDARLYYDATLFYMEKDEVIFQDADRQNISGAQTRHYGAELSFALQFKRNWSLAADATVASHSYDKRVELLGSDGDIKGNDIDTAPNVFGSARLGWDFSGVTGQSSRVELEWVYMDSYYLEPDNLEKYDGHSLFNLRLNSTLGKRWSGGLRVTNLLDEDYAERADFGFNDYRYFVGQPRGLYVNVGYQFGDPGK